MLIATFFFFDESTELNDAESRWKRSFSDHQKEVSRFLATLGNVEVTSFPLRSVRWFPEPPGGSSHTDHMLTLTLVFQMTRPVPAHWD